MNNHFFSSLFLMICLISTNITANNTLKPQRIASNNTEEVITIDRNDLDFVKKIQKHKKELLTLGQNCLFLLTQGKDAFINVYQPDINSYKVIKLGYYNEEINSNNHLTEAEQFENMIVLSEMTNVYSANIRVQKKYPGDRESVLGEKLANIFFSENEYKGKILIDEYKSNIPMFWVLNNVEELRSIAKYITKNIENATNKEKPLLVIKILNDPKLETLIQKDIEFLNSYFNICSIQDPEVKEFFENAKENMFDRGSNMSSPRYKGETVLESVFRQTEKQFKEFKTKDWAVIAGVFVFSNILYSELKDGIDYTLEKARGGERTFTRKILKKLFG